MIRRVTKINFIVRSDYLATSTPMLVGDDASSLVTRVEAAKLIMSRIRFEEHVDNFYFILLCALKQLKLIAFLLDFEH